MAAVAARSAVAAREILPPPSSFAVLLRRSKFASYDPHIGQVYTTFGGDAHRGNFGLKRPLALRKRGAYVTIGSIDSRQQQTEWDNSAKEVRWVRKFQEVGRPPQTSFESEFWRMAGPNARWEVDTDFALNSRRSESTKDVDDDVQILTPNVAAMKQKQFERHIDKLKTLRPAFREYVKVVAQKESSLDKKKHKPVVRSTNLLEQSQHLSALHKTFLSRQLRKEMQSLESRVIGQQLHPSAGLFYSQFSDLQHFLLRKPLPGRFIAESNNGWSGHVAAFAGMIAEMGRRQSEGLQPLDWKILVEHGVDTEKGISDFRMSDAQLSRAPVVVGSKPEKLDQMQMRTSVSSHGKSEEMIRANPHLPWTREYVAHLTGRIVPIRSTIRSPLRKRKQLKEPGDAGNVAAQNNLLTTLFDMVKKGPQVKK